MRAVGDRYRAAGVAAIYLVHGTFVGADAWGILHALARLHPPLRAYLEPMAKGLVDRLLSDIGNYTGFYARKFEDAINHGGAEPRIPVRRFLWSSQNNHIGRADAAVRLLEELAAASAAQPGRLLLWGHSHAGNVFALLTNLLAADETARRRFFEAASVYYRWPGVGVVDIPHWRRVEQLLGQRAAFDPKLLDLVTFGTPIRYGWDSDGYGHLLHFIHHRTADDHCRFPPKLEKILAAADGDYVQQLGIAGTNLMPSWFSWRSYLADRRLNALLQHDVEPADLLSRLRAGRRIPDEGTTILVDYGPETAPLAHHLAGHAVYTRTEWLLFHAETVAEVFYG